MSSHKLSCHLHAEGRGEGFKYMMIQSKEMTTKLFLEISGLGYQMKIKYRYNHTEMCDLDISYMHHYEGIFYKTSAHSVLHAEMADKSQVKH